MRALALDVGSRTIGLARAGEAGIATAWETLARQGHAADALALVGRIEAEAVTDVVVGLPLELDGREGHRVRLVRRFSSALRDALAGRACADGRVPRPVRLHEWDERFSTAAAERALAAGAASARVRKASVDALAAQFILQGWLDAGCPGASEGSRPAEGPPA